LFFVAFSMSPPVLPGVGKKALANKLMEASSKSKETDFSSRKNFTRGNIQKPENRCKL